MYDVGFAGVVATGYLNQAIRRLTARDGGVWLRVPGNRTTASNSGSPPCSRFDAAYLFATRFNPKGCAIGLDRDLVRVPFRITAAARDQ